MIELYIPKYEELSFRKTMCEDPETMSYNKNYAVTYEGYHPETGCVDFPEEKWQEWYAKWIGNEPERYYAYIKRQEDGAFLGEVSFHYNEEKKRHDMSIVIYAPYRGMGYAVPSLKLMIGHAFGSCFIGRLYNEFEIERRELAAWKTHFSAGFREVGQENGWLSVMMTRENWLDSIMQLEEDEDIDPFYSLRMRF